MGRHSGGDPFIQNPDVIVPTDHYTDRGEQLAAEFDAADLNPVADGIVEVNLHAHGS
jgi:hypothetical protein